MSTNWFNIKKRYKIFSATLENINSQLRKFSKKNGELDVGKISRASSIASIPNLESTSEFLRFTHALVDEAEELEAHGCKLDDEQRREINGLFVRTYSLISNVFKPLKHKRTSRSGLDESFGFFRIKDYNQFIEIMSLAEPGVSFYAQLDVFMEKLRIVWGDFEHVSNSTIVGTTMDLLLDLCIAIEDNLIVIDTVPEKIAKSEHEDVLQDMLKYERQNPPVSDYVTSSDVSNFYKNFLTEASTSSTNKLYIDRDEFEQYSKLFENHCDVTKLWSPNILFSKDRKYSKHALTEFIDSIRVVINEKLDSLTLHGTFDTILLNATSSNSIYNSKTPSRLKITAENQFTLRLLRPLRHKNIAKILHICKNCECDQSESCTHNVLGFINDPGSFSFDVLLELGVISERILVKASVDIVCGLAYLHKYGIMHRDLRPSNIILSGKDIKISGLDAIFNLKTQKVVRLNRNSASTYSLVMAPEVLPTRTMSRKSDIYSFGLLLYRLCVRVTSNIVEDTPKLATVAVDRLTEKLREPFKSIICSSMNYERDQRPKSIDLETQLTDYFKNIKTPQIKFRLPNEQETYLHLNLLRRALVLFKPIKNSSVVTKFYMSLLLENQLGLMKFEENSKDENTISFENGVRCFLEWEQHIEECQNDLRHLMESVDLLNNF